MIFPPAACTILDTWHTTGLAGTGSHDFVVEEVFKPSPRRRALYRIMLIDVHRVAKKVVSAMYDLAATSAIYRSHPLDRLMRDILTACQHGVVHPKMYRPAGRLLLGMESGDPLF